MCDMWGGAGGLVGGLLTVRVIIISYFEWADCPMDGV